MEPIQLLDISTIGVLCIATLIYGSSIIGAKYTDIKQHKILNYLFFTGVLLSFIGISLYIDGFVDATYYFLLLFALIVIPYAIIFLGAWNYSDNNMRILTNNIYAAWLISLGLMFIIRLIFGWGLDNSTISIWIFIMFSSILNGIIGFFISQRIKPFFR